MWRRPSDWNLETTFLRATPHFLTPFPVCCFLLLLCTDCSLSAFFFPFLISSFLLLPPFPSSHLASFFLACFSFFNPPFSHFCHASFAFLPSFSFHNFSFYHISFVIPLIFLFSCSNTLYLLPSSSSCLRLFILSFSLFSTLPSVSFFTSSSSSLFLLSMCPPSSFPPVSWFLLVLSRQLVSHNPSRSYCSLWLSGRSSGHRTISSAVAQDQSLSPGRVRLISGLSGLVLAGRARAARGVWVVDARCSVGGAGVEGAL